MAQNLESIFQELGISQYLDIFLEQGFDTWDTILDITESDLGHAPDVSLVSPTRASVEEPKTETQRPDQPRPENKEGPIQAKRKYRRHPKNLTPAEKEPYETSALKAKEKYNHDLAEYKKTPEFRKYTAYLADFKARQASANQGEMLCFIPTPMHY
ncbi:hypothetical protein COL154_000721 [Colletotrichum chrysophilum]|nr:hypothetical protein COL154_000721 [Colletotrichum chrysophilum]